MSGAALKHSDSVVKRGETTRLIKSYRGGKWPLAPFLALALSLSHMYNVREEVVNLGRFSIVPATCQELLLSNVHCAVSPLSCPAAQIRSDPICSLKTRSAYIQMLYMFKRAEKYLHLQFCRGPPETSADESDTERSTGIPDVTHVL